MFWYILTECRRQLPPTIHSRVVACQCRFFFGYARTVFRNLLSGDDHINPKKLLERRYIYFALLATRFRSLRLAADSSTTETTLYERAVQELDQEGVEEKPNMTLRQQLQDALRPQVLEIFAAFRRVDDRLGMGMETTDGGSLAQVNWGLLLSILNEERQRSCTADSPFLKRKLAAIDLLLRFHADGTLEPDHGGDVDVFGTPLAGKRDTKSLRLIRQHQTINLARSALIRQELGFSVISLQSSIPNAGRGLYLDGNAMVGSLVAFQPGDVWPKEHLLTNAPEVMEHFGGDDEDCQISLRFDDYVVDSRQSPITVLSRPGSMNPWALGHMVNHPSAGTLPNCQSTMLDFTKRMQLNELLRYVPNTYARAPGWQSRFFFPEPIDMHGLSLLARRDIVNEELFYDYRLQSDVTPDWYSVVQYQGESMMDKEQVVFFRDDWREKT